VIYTENCNRKQLAGFLSDQLEVDERLEFLVHVETCSRCWDEIYNARKSEHPHYYKTTARQVKITDKELQRIDSPARQAEESEGAYQVA
jgi:hypothetical protein